MAEKIIRKNQFEHDSGYLAKSPCRECPQKRTLPKCSKNCRTLIQLQKLLVGVISYSNSLSEIEEYSLSRQDA